MSKSAIDYEAMPTADEARRWALSSAQRRLLASIIDKPRPYETDGRDANELRRLSDGAKSKPGVVTLFYPNQNAQPIWQATAAGYGLMAKSLPDKLKKHAAEYHRARNWGRTDKLPSKVCGKCNGDFKAGWYDTSEFCPSCEALGDAAINSKGWALGPLSGVVEPFAIYHYYESGIAICQGIGT